MRLASVVGFSLAVPALLLGLAGCSAHVMNSGGDTTGTAATPPPATTPSGHLTGIVHGGQQPVSGSSIQLYAVGATSTTALLTTPVTSDSGGGFDITGKYSCPGGDPLVYLAGLGGNPGAGTNSKLAMMVLLGNCSTLQSMTFVTINEVTSVAAVVSAAKYMTSATTITYGSDAAGAASAFNTATAVVNPSTGTVGGPNLPAGEGVSTAEVNTLANIMASCINSTGDTSAGSPCGILLSATNGTDTITALLAAIDNPTSNAALLCSLASTTAPFQPQLADCGTGATSNAPSGSLPDPAPLPLTANPVFTPNHGVNGDGVYNLGTTVTISDATSGATIYYTTDGTSATHQSPTYTGGAITVPDVNTGVSICAIAVAPQHVDGYACTNFTAATDSPTFLETGAFPGPFTFNSSVVPTVVPYGAPQLNPTNQVALSGPVALSSATAGAALYYVIDSTGQAVPTTTSSKYTGPLPLTAGQFLNVMALAANRAPSLIAHMAFQVQIPQVTISPANGPYDPGTVVTMTDADPNNVDIRYTTDGTFPTTSSLLYNSALTLSTSERYIALAFPHGTQPTAPNVAPFISPYYTTEADFAISPYTGVFSLVAGDYNGNTLSYGYNSDGGAATGVALAGPAAVAVGSDGTIYIADTVNNCVRAVSSAGQMTKFAGECGTTANYGGDGGVATKARFNSPAGLAVDNNTGKVYIVDRGNSCVRVVSGGVINTFAGVCKTLGFNGTGMSATSTYLNTPEGVAVDEEGNVYIADTYNNVVREVDHSSNEMDVVAGLLGPSGGISGDNGDGSYAALARLAHPAAVALDASGNLYLSDVVNNNVRRVDSATGFISTVATGLNEPEGIAVDSGGNLYIANTGTSKVLKVTTQGLTVYAGDGNAGYGGYGGPAAAAWLGGPVGLAFNSTDDLYITTYPYPGSSVVMVHH